MGFGIFRHLSIPFLKSSAPSPASHSGARSIKLGQNEHLICEDISNGREAVEIPALSYKRNDQPPLDYYYVSDHITYEDPLDMDTTLMGVNCCTCLGDCSGSDCACTTKYNSAKCYNAEGRLSDEYDISAPEVIMECNARCWCNPKKCQNMVIQNGPKCQLALIRTKSRGWGVRTLEPLKRGTFVGIYSGELMSAAQSFGRRDDTYLFNLESVSDRDKRERSNHQSQPTLTELAEEDEYDIEQEAYSCAGGNIVVDESDLETATVTNRDHERLKDSNDIEQADNQPEEQEVSVVEEYNNQSLENKDQRQEEEEEEEEEEPQEQRQVFERNLKPGPFVCDAKFFGNFTRFINHSCNPNVVGIRTFTVHQDRRFPYISFFTNKDIPSNTELTLNYGDNYWLVKCKRDGIYCLCKQSNCRFTRNSYPETLRQHNRSKSNV